MRVYTIDPDPAKGERSGSGRKLVTHQGDELWPVQRVAFDADADEGLATVTALVPSFRRPDGGDIVVSGFILDPEANAPVGAVFRAWVRLLPPGENPRPDPDAILTKSDDGRVTCLPGEFFEPKIVEAS